MSEISKFHAADDFSGELCVYATDFDRVTAERDALQERLNAADQKDDDLSFQLKDREGSRRDWFEAAQAAEKRVEELEAELADQKKRHTEDLQLSRRRFCWGSQLEAKLAERDALLRDSRMYVATCRAADPEHHRGVLVRIEAALSASAEPSAPVERDERAEFEAYALDRGWLPQHLAEKTASGNYKDWGVNPEWQAWKARAALDKSTEGASHE
ncbi:hypothetical protein A9978_18785 [Pseudomonas sp. UMC65]|uniref:hypothetical protein n=1 Tax=Pseudomonas sp. UMC65 TaxID=1862323 RepID=UPI0015FF124A|nr:hypothetical protein [Pseudomonas sp. UMC65]MBB1614487.1 hypothetical protein [Pseudomonas sp. UMC65]